MTENIHSQFQSLFSRQLSPITTKLSSLDNKLSTSPLIYNKKVTLKQIPKFYQIMFVKLLQNILKGVRYYKSKYAAQQSQYRVVRMKSYHSIIETINCLDQTFKKYRPNNVNDMYQIVEMLRKQMQEGTKIIEKVDEEITGVIMNLEEFINQESYNLFKEMELRQMHPESVRIQEMLEKMTEEDLLNFIEKNSNDKEILKYVGIRKQEIEQIDI